MNLEQSHEWWCDDDQDDDSVDICLSKNMIKMKKLLELKNIKKSYKLWKWSIEVLHGLDFEVEEWDFYSIMWQSWSWKSTLMNIVWMLDNPSSWDYFFDGTDVWNLTDDEQSMIRRTNIWFIFQTYNLLPKVRLIKQVSLPLMYQWIWRKERDKRATEALERVWLWDKLNNAPTELSGWQQQRVAIARAIVSQPKLLLADEPTWALDSNTSKEVLELICQLNKEWRTIIMITHDDEVAEYASKHVILKDGYFI